MTTVEILFRYATPPTESQIFALSSAREVYGIRRLSIDRAAHTLRVEYDATRLNAAAVTQLVRGAGLQIAEELSLIPPLPVPAPTAPAV
jgi:hypothetical protein